MTLCCTSVQAHGPGHGIRERGSPAGTGHGGASGDERQTMALTSSGMPGPKVVDTAPFWM